MPLADISSEIITQKKEEEDTSSEIITDRPSVDRYSVDL